MRKGGGRVRITAQLIDALERRASLGRPLRRLARRCLRAAGQGSDQRRRHHRAGVAGRRNRAVRPTARQTISRPTISTCALCANVPWLRKEQILRGTRLARAGDRARSALRPGTRLGRDLCHLRLCLDGWSEDPEARSSRRRIDLAPAGTGRSPVTTRVFWPMPRSRSAISARTSARMIALIDRCPGAQSELRPRLVCQRLSQVYAGQHDVAIEHLESVAAAEPTRASGSAPSLDGNRHGSFLQPTFR